MFDGRLEQLSVGNRHEANANEMAADIASSAVEKKRGKRSCNQKRLT
jgi:hypothetical protein